MNEQIEEIHYIILADAADMANIEVGREPGFERFSGQIFHADPAERPNGKGGLALVLDDIATRSLNRRQIARLHEIGREAIRKAIVQNKEGFVGLIIGDAREGRDYFERFASPNQQTRLF